MIIIFKTEIKILDLVLYNPRLLSLKLKLEFSI